MKKSQLFAITALVTSLLYTDFVSAEVMKAQIENRDYKYGDVIWILPLSPHNVNQSFTIKLDDIKKLEPNLSKGEIGIAAHPDAGSSESSIMNLELPTNDTLDPVNENGLKWTIIGNLEATFDGQISPIYWSNTVETATKKTIEFLYGVNQRIPGLAKTDNTIDFEKDLFKNSQTQTDILLRGTATVAIICAKSQGCKRSEIPSTVWLPSVSVSINSPITPAFVQKVTILKEMTQVDFAKIATCRMSLSPVHFNVGPVGIQNVKSGIALMTANAVNPSGPIMSKLVVDCSDYPIGINKSMAVKFEATHGLQGTTVAKANPTANGKDRGIGFVYSTEKIQNCNSGVGEFGKNVKIKQNPNSYVNEQHFYFGVCQYLPSNQVEKGPFEGSIQYTYWLD